MILAHAIYAAVPPTLVMYEKTCPAVNLRFMSDRKPHRLEVRIAT